MSDRKGKSGGRRPRPTLSPLGAPIGFRAQGPTSFPTPPQMFRKAAAAPSGPEGPSASSVSTGSGKVAFQGIGAGRRDRRFVGRDDGHDETPRFPAPFVSDRVAAMAPMAALDAMTLHRGAGPHRDAAAMALFGADAWREHLSTSPACIMAMREDGSVVCDPVFRPLGLVWSPVDRVVSAKHAVWRALTPGEILDEQADPFGPRRIDAAIRHRLVGLPVETDGQAGTMRIWADAFCESGAAFGRDDGASPPAEPWRPDPAGHGHRSADGSVVRDIPTAWGGSGLGVLHDPDLALEEGGLVTHDPLAMLITKAARLFADARAGPRDLRRREPGVRMIHFGGRVEFASLGPILAAELAVAVAVLWPRMAARLDESDRLARRALLPRERVLDLEPAGAAWLDRQIHRLRVEALADGLRLLPLARQRRSGGAFERLLGERPAIAGDGLNGAAFDPLQAFPLVVSAFPGLPPMRMADYHEAWALLRREAFAGVALAAKSLGLDPKRVGDARRRSWAFQGPDGVGGSGGLGAHDGDAARDEMAFWIAGIGRRPEGADPSLPEAGLGLGPAPESSRPWTVVAGQVGRDGLASRAAGPVLDARAWGVAPFEPLWAGAVPEGLATALEAGCDGIEAGAVLTPTPAGMRRDASHPGEGGGGPPEVGGLTVGRALCDSDRLGALLAARSRVEADRAEARAIEGALDPVRRFRFGLDPWGIWPGSDVDGSPLDWSRLPASDPRHHAVLAFEAYSGMGLPPAPLASRACFTVARAIRLEREDLRAATAQAAAVAAGDPDPRDAVPPSDEILRGWPRTAVWEGGTYGEGDVLETFPDGSKRLVRHGRAAVEDAWGWPVQTPDLFERHRIVPAAEIAIADPVFNPPGLLAQVREVIAAYVTPLVLTGDEYDEDTPEEAAVPEGEWWKWWEWAPEEHEE